MTTSRKLQPPNPSHNHPPPQPANPSFLQISSSSSSSSSLSLTSSTHNSEPKITLSPFRSYMCRARRRRRPMEKIEGQLNRPTQHTGGLCIEGRTHKVQDLESDNYVGGNSKQTIELYGKWQLEPLDLPHAVNGIMPKVNCF
ncbi:PREDICTED: DNA repair [Prunus dulcis]|uniref:PREDICTED: DNA repair n=1 Tax=Prunus dulcis TaxID=3755 RepID=A0A5E4FNS3_PRUDU|nr:PREDICTED: DNA repair [Prunus dulcis]